jgi:uncharacterized protein YhaN
VSSVEALETNFNTRAELDRRCESLTKSINSLTNKTEYQRYFGLETVKLKNLEEEIATVDFTSLPDPKTWAVEMAQAKGALDKPQSDVRRLEEWLKRNPISTLKSDLQEAETKSKEIGEKATQEPWYGREGEPDFIDQYRQAERQQTTLADSLTKAVRDMATMEQQLDGKPDLAELKSREVHALTTFETRKEEYKAYQTIKSQLSRLMEESDKAVYDPIRTTLVRYINQVTGSRYAPTEFSGSAVVAGQFVRGKYAPFSPEHLSQGTNESIALATRLALAEFYLEGRKGFLILDDVMVNMDPERVALSASIIQDFASRYQVLYCTCHPAHAEALGGNRISLERMA